jgi:serine/threonine protein kinase
MTELQELADRLDKAADYTTIFTDVGSMRAVYLKMAGVLHPDRYEGTDEHEVATKAFARLTQLHNDAQKALDEDHFGQPVIRTKRGVHVVKRRLDDGDIAALYRTDTGLMKVARSARDNDLMAAEATALKRLHSVDDKFTRHYPMLLDTFLHREGRRRANVIQYYPDCYDLRQLRQYFPKGMDPRHVTWIWRRLLMALGFAHDQSILHGAVLPPHILILPKDHGVVLVDWCYSVTMPVSDSQSKTPPIRAVVGDYRSWYPEEVTKKEAPSGATDLVMAARSMIYLLGGVPTTGVLPDWVPRMMRAYFKGCLAVPQAMRPNNPWALLTEFDDLLERIGEPFFPRRFVELAMPTVGAAT